MTQGSGVFGSGQITIAANQTIEKPIYSIPVYPSSGGKIQQLALFSSEYNAISSGIVGMKANDQKRIPISSNISMIQLLSAEQLGTMKIDMNNISLGDNFYGLVQTNTEEFANNTTANSFLRIGEVANKSQDGIEVDFSYSVAEVRVVSINKER